MKNNNLISPDAEYLSISEVGKLFSPPISYVTLYKWLNHGELQLNSYQLGRLKFYNKQEVLSEIKKHKLVKDEQ